jgi:hypothetical protein
MVNKRSISFHKVPRNGVHITKTLAQALASHVDDPTSIVVALSTHVATQWQATLDAKYQSLISNHTQR